MKNKLFLLPSLVLILSTACGGGGGGSDTPFFGGVYDVNMVKVSDTCGINSDNTINLRHTVNQDGRKVVVDIGSVVLQGSVTDDNRGFDTTASTQVGNCNTTTAVVYRPTEQANADYGVGLAVVSQCGAEGCEISYGGTARKR